MKMKWPIPCHEMHIVIEPRVSKACHDRSRTFFFFCLALLCLRSYRLEYKCLNNQLLACFFPPTFQSESFFTLGFLMWPLSRHGLQSSISVTRLSDPDKMLWIYFPFCFSRGGWDRGGWRWAFTGMQMGLSQCLVNLTLIVASPVSDLAWMCGGAWTQPSFRGCHGHHWRPTLFQQDGEQAVSQLGGTCYQHEHCAWGSV